MSNETIIKCGKIDELVLKKYIELSDKKLFSDLEVNDIFYYVPKKGDIGYILKNTECLWIKISEYAAALLYNTNIYCGWSLIERDRRELNDDQIVVYLGHYTPPADSLLFSKINDLNKSEQISDIVTDIIAWIIVIAMFVGIIFGDYIIIKVVFKECKPIVSVVLSIILFMIETDVVYSFSKD